MAGQLGPPGVPVTAPVALECKLGSGVQDGAIVAGVGGRERNMGEGREGVLEGGEGDREDRNEGRQRRPGAQAAYPPQVPFQPSGCFWGCPV